jgi:hypothetical protein
MSAILIIMLSSLVSQSQKIVDTTALYRGEYTKKRTEFSAGGLIQKETWYYPDGRIEEESFYNDGESYYWISYDQYGKMTAEWGDRQNMQEKWRKRRRWILSITIVCFAGVTIAAARKNFENTFYISLILTLIVPFLIMITEKWLRTQEGNQNFELIVASLIFLIPGSLLILSLISFSKRIKIPWYMAILGMLVSVAFLLFFDMVANIAGAGILG